MAGDVLDLPATERLVDHDGDATARERPVERRRRVRASLEEDRHAVSGSDPQRHELTRDGGGACEQLAVRRRRVAFDDRNALRAAPGRVPERPGEVRIQGQPQIFVRRHRLGWVTGGTSGNEIAQATLASLDARALTNAPIAPSEPRFCSVTSSSPTATPKRSSMNATSSITPMESMMPRSSSE